MCHKFLSGLLALTLILSCAQTIQAAVSADTAAGSDIYEAAESFSPDTAEAVETDQSAGSFNYVTSDSFTIAPAEEEVSAEEDILFASGDSETTSSSEAVVYQEIHLGEQAEVTLSEDAPYAWFTYTATANMTIAFYSSGSYDTYGYIYDENDEQLAYNDDYSDGETSTRNFHVEYDVTAGTTYHLMARFYSTSNSGSFTVGLKRAGSAPAISSDSFALAKGYTAQIELKNTDYASEASLTSSDPSIASVDASGLVTAVSQGTASITYEGTDIDGIPFASTVTVTVTNPKLVKSTVGLNLYNKSKSDDGCYYFYNDTEMVRLKGFCDSSTIGVSSSSGNLLFSNYGVKDGILYLRLAAKKKGTYTINIILDGKPLTCKVVVGKVYFKYNSKQNVIGSGVKKWYPSYGCLTMYEGESTTLKVKGCSEDDTITYKSSKTSVATVTSAGKVKAVGNGKCKITAPVNGISISYQVEVSYKTAIKALRYCYKYFGSTYSQEKRMQEGYYDCSSYVWRAYHSAGMNLGSDNWAPTAADLAKWCVSKKIMVYSGNVPASKLKPGDLVFECGSDNGRYQGIYHVDIYEGDGFGLTVENIKDWYGSTLYDVMVARPCGGKVKMKTLS